MLLGEMLIQKKVLTDAQLQTYLEKAKASGKMLGELLVAEKIITKEELFAYLREQGFLRNGV
ncbi:MAG: hypothetical protein HZC28_02050 [Spirochaetes bacterium]|nr:hypothetical protein [Spirochaetota bacterium]